jgi:hypothetical protein
MKIGEMSPKKLNFFTAKMKDQSILKCMFAIGALFHTLVVLWPILTSPFSGDDTFDSMLPMQLSYSGQSSWSYINSYVSNWSANEGRFFPVAAIVGLFGHNLFPGRVEYKIAQLVMVLIALLVFALLVSKLFKNFYAGILVVLILSTCLQMHVQYDPLFQFSLQQPFLMTVISGSLLFFVAGIRSQRNWELLLSAMLYLVALLTYESSLLIWPIFIFLIVIERPSKFIKPLMMSAAPAIIVGLNLVRLRSKVTTSSAGYTSNFEFAALTKTFAKQAIGSLPMSYSELNTPPFLQAFPEHFNFGSIWWLLSVGIAVLLVFVLLPRVASSNHKLNIGVALVGLVLWFVPALVVAQTVRWQNEVVLGNAYITWFQGSFGFSLVAIGILLECKTILSKFPKAVSICGMSLFAIFIGVATSSVVTNNPRAVAQFNPGYLWPRETFESAITSGVFAEVAPKDPVLALGAEWWLNAPFVSWWGGPKIEQMDSQRSEAQWGLCVSEPTTCLERQRYTDVVATYGFDLSGLRVVMVGRVIEMGGSIGSISSAMLVSPRVFIDYPSSSSSEIESQKRCLAWSIEKIIKLKGSFEAGDAEVLDVKKESCLLKFGSGIALDVYQFNPN